jgi:hypothetical protein
MDRRKKRKFHFILCIIDFFYFFLAVRNQRERNQFFLYELRGLNVDYTTHSNRLIHFLLSFYCEIFTFLLSLLKKPPLKLCI